MSSVRAKYDATFKLKVVNAALKTSNQNAAAAFWIIKKRLDKWNQVLERSYVSDDDE